MSILTPIEIDHLPDTGKMIRRPVMWTLGGAELRRHLMPPRRRITWHTVSEIALAACAATLLLLFVALMAVPA